MGIKFVPFNRRENRRSLAIFFAEQIAHLGVLIRGLQRGGVKNHNKRGCKRLFTFVCVCPRLLAFACVFASAFACVCLRLSAFARICLRPPLLPLAGVSRGATRGFNLCLLLAPRLRNTMGRNLCTSPDQVWRNIAALGIACEPLICEELLS